MSECPRCESLESRLADSECVVDELREVLSKVAPLLDRAEDYIKRDPHGYCEENWLKELEAARALLQETTQ